MQLPTPQNDYYIPDFMPRVPLAYTNYSRNTQHQAQKVFPASMP